MPIGFRVQALGRVEGPIESEWRFRVQFLGFRVWASGCAKLIAMLEGSWVLASGVISHVRVVSCKFSYLTSNPT